MKRPFAMVGLCLGLGLASGAFAPWVRRSVGPVVSSTRASGEIAASPASPETPSAAWGPRLPRPTSAEVREAREPARLPLLIRWLPEATAEELQDMAAWVMALDYDHSHDLWEALVVRWVEVEPSAVVSAGRTLAARVAPNVTPSFRWSRQQPLMLVYRYLARLEPELMLALLAEESMEFLRQIQNQGVLNRAIAPDQWSAWAASMPDRPNLARLIKGFNTGLDMSRPEEAARHVTAETTAREIASLASAWADQDPVAARAWAEGLTSPHQRAQALAIIAAELAPRDLAAARSLLDTLPTGLDRASAETRYVAALAKTDPVAAQAFAKEKLHGLARQQALTEIAAVLSQTDPAAALKLLRDHGVRNPDRHALGDLFIRGPMATTESSGGNQALQRVLEAALPGHPEVVMDFLAASGGFALRSERAGGSDYLSRMLFQKWADTQPVEAVRWLNALALPAETSLPSGVTSTLSAALSEWYDRDAAGVRAYVEQLPEGPARQRSVIEVTNRLATDDPVAALAWGAGQQGEASFAEVMRRVAWKDPVAMAAHFAEVLTPAQQEAGFPPLLTALGRRDAAAVPGFFASLPPEWQATASLAEPVKQMIGQDPFATTEWLASLPAQPSKDSAIGSVLDYLLRDAPENDLEAAAHWAAATHAEDNREKNLQRVAQAWTKADPQGAAAAIHASTLPEAIKQSLLPAFTTP